MWPEPYATIAREREKGTPSVELAETLDIHVTTLKAWVRKWNRDNPNNPLPPHARQTRVPRYIEAANHHKQGRTLAETAALMDVTKVTVTGLWSQARQKGLLPRITPRTKRNGYERYKHFYLKGAAPRLGQFRTVLDTLGLEGVQDLLDRIDYKNDTTLAHTLARIVREHLRDNPKG